MKITLKQLRRLNACEDQVLLFERFFGTGIEVTEALCLAHAQDFDWNWAAYNLLSPSAREAYGEARALARKAYDEALALAEKAYDEALALAGKAYDEALALAFARATLASETPVPSPGT